MLPADQMGVRYPDRSAPPAANLVQELPRRLAHLLPGFFCILHTDLPYIGCKLIHPDTFITEGNKGKKMVEYMRLELEKVRLKSGRHTDLPYITGWVMVYPC